MALPSQAIDKLTEAPSGTQGAFRQLILLAVALLVLMLVLYAGLAFGYSKYLQGTIDKNKTEIDAFSQKFPKDAQEQAASFYSQLSNLGKLLDSHATVSPVLALLERASTPNVYYTKLSVNVGTNEASLTGAARSLADIAQQVALLESQTDQVARVNFANAGQSSGNPWQFTMNVYLKPGVLRNGVAAAPSAPVVPNASTTASSSAIVPPFGLDTPTPFR